MANNVTLEHSALLYAVAQGQGSHSVPLASHAPPPPCTSSCLSSALCPEDLLLPLDGTAVLGNPCGGLRSPPEQWRPRWLLLRMQQCPRASQPVPDRCPFPSAQCGGERPLLPPVGKLPGHSLQRLHPEDPGPHGGPAAVHAPWAPGEGVGLHGVEGQVRAPVGWVPGPPSLRACGGRSCGSSLPGLWGERCRDRSAPARPVTCI